MTRLSLLSLLLLAACERDPGVLTVAECIRIATVEKACAPCVAAPCDLGIPSGEPATADAEETPREAEGDEEPLK